MKKLLFMIGLCMVFATKIFASPDVIDLECDITNSTDYRAQVNFVSSVGFLNIQTWPVMPNPHSTGSLLKLSGNPLNDTDNNFAKFEIKFNGLERTLILYMGTNYTALVYKNSITNSVYSENGHNVFSALVFGEGDHQIIGNLSSTVMAYGSVFYGRMKLDLYPAN